MDWDEGPDKPGNTVLTVNQNVNIYNPLIEQLIAEDKAYKCYMTEENWKQSIEEDNDARGENAYAIAVMLT